MLDCYRKAYKLEYHDPRCLKAILLLIEMLHRYLVLLSLSAILSVWKPTV